MISRRNIRILLNLLLLFFMSFHLTR